MKNNEKFELTPDIIERIEKLHQKYQPLGQDMVSYLDGLYYANQTTYWDYLHVDTLLSLQTPRTPFPDEQIFIIYHQITELYFKLIQLELGQFRLNSPDFTVENLLLRLERINHYFYHLSHSFTIMTNGMDAQQFLQFRMSLLPASGFQSAQFREIELRLTGVYELTSQKIRPTLKPDDSLQNLYPHLYWKYGNREEASGEKTLTLKMFEQKYDDRFFKLAQDSQHTNLYAAYLSLPPDVRNDKRLVQEMRALDEQINIGWRYAHYHSVKGYMEKGEAAAVKTETGLRTYEGQPDVVKSTGGTNWKQYLPPRAQKIVFFPAVWSAEELAKWGE